MATNAQVLKRIRAARDAAVGLGDAIPDNKEEFDEGKLSKAQKKLLGDFNEIMGGTMKAIRTPPPPGDESKTKRKKAPAKKAPAKKTA